MSCPSLTFLCGHRRSIRLQHDSFACASSAVFSARAIVELAGVCRNATHYDRSCCIPIRSADPVAGWCRGDRYFAHTVRSAVQLWCEAVGGLVSGPPAEPATESPASRRHAGRRSLPPSISLVAAAVAPRRSSRVKPAAAYTRDVRPTVDQRPARPGRHLSSLAGPRKGGSLAPESRRRAARSLHPPRFSSRRGKRREAMRLCSFTRDIM